MKNIGGVNVNIKEGSIKKMCSFYVSDWHLTTMILPYVSKMVEEDTQVETILEEGIKEKINELTSKLNMNPDMKQKILNINWNSTKREMIKQKNEDINQKKIILVNGTKERIQEVNDQLEEELSDEEKERTTIINCYDVTKTKENVQEILGQHQNIINTSGKHEIEEVFPLLGK